MKVTVIRATELNDEQLRRWAMLQEADPALHSPYFCPQFTQAVASVRDDVFVGVMEEAGKIVGFFPFQKGKLSMGRAVGGALSDFHGVIADANAEWDAGELVRKCGLSTWDFDHLVASQQAFALFVQKTAESLYLDLSDGFEAYALARRESGSEQIKKTGNLRRRLEREVGALRFEAHEVNPDVLKTLLSWKSRQYLESNLADVFAVKWTVALLERLLHTQQTNFGGMLSTLYANGRLVAAHMGMRSADVWHYWYPSYDQEFQKYSPGLILLLKIAEAAPALGVRTIDMGKGESMYKQRLASGAKQLAEGCVETPSLVGRLRKLRRGAEGWAENTPLEGISKLPGRLMRRLERNSRFH